MSDLVSMVTNINKVNIDDSKQTSNTKQNVNLNSKEINKNNVQNNNFKSVLNKAAKIDDGKNQESSIETSDNKLNEISENAIDSSDSSKASKKKTALIDILLILILQHLGDDKVDLKEIMDKLEQEDSKGSSEDVTNSILNLIGEQGIEGIDINSLKSSEDLYKKINDIIKALSKSSEKDDTLKSILSKLNDLNNKDLDSKSIKELFKSLPEEKNQNLQNQIINALKSKLLDSKSDNKNANADVENIKNPLEVNLNSKITVSADNETKNEFKNGSSEEEFLKNLVSSDKSKSESKIDKLTNFMNDFNKVNNTVSKDIEAEVPVNINKNNLVNDFIKSIKYMEQNNVKEMTVKVKPQELGEVVIRLTVENGLMKANITANNKEAYNLLNSKLQDLNNSLGNGEIKIQNFTIDIYNGDTTFFSRENSKEQRNNSSNHTKERSSSISALEDNKDNEEISQEILNSNVNAFV